MPFTVRSPAASQRVTRHPYLHSCRAASPASLTLVLREVHTVKIQRLGQVGGSRPGRLDRPRGAAAPTTTPDPRRARPPPAPRHRADCFERHPERRGLLRAEERLRGGGLQPSTTACPGAHRELQPDRLRRRHQAVHRRPGRLRRLRLGAEDRGEGRRDRGRRRRQDAAAPPPGTSRWSPARSRSPTTSTGVDKLDPHARPSPPTSSTARSPPGTTRPSPRSTPASPCPSTADQGVLPLRRVGHHRELHQVPQRRGPGQLDRRARPRCGPARVRARRSRPASPRA